MMYRPVRNGADSYNHDALTRRCVVRSRHVVTVVLIGCLVAIIGAPKAGAQIRWRTGLSERSGKTRAEVIATIATPGPRGEGRHLVLQFDEPITPTSRAALAGAGITLQGYLGDYAFFASVARNGVDPAALSTIPSLADALEIQSAWKLHPVLNRGENPDWAVVPVPPSMADRPGMADKTWFGAYILFHEDVTMATASRIVEAHEGVIRRRLRTVNGMVIELPLSQSQILASEDVVSYLEPALPKMDDLNDLNRSITEADIVQAPPYNLDGSGVNVLVYDGGTARASHVDFQGRLNVRDTSGLSNHSTHVSGTIGGAGVANPAYKGMAPGVTIQSYGFEQAGGLQPGFLYTDPGDLELDYGEAINVYGAHIANNSIGTNTAPNGFPCAWEGDYGVTSTVIDSVVRGSLGGNPFRIVWANGNERASGRCGTTYHTTAPPACAKNHITVGALNSNDDSVTWFTSWGPTDDDRLKPDISAPGCQIGGDGGVTSCSAVSDTSYTTFCGTSMASPTVCGISALLLQDFRVQFPGQPDFRNSTLKALLAHNAQDIESVGPDYKTGYGSVRIQRTVDFMRTGAFTEDSVSQGTIFSRTVDIVAGDPELKVTLAWDDPPGTPNVSPALVNDLDLRVTSPSGVQHFPWTLGGLANPSAPAVRTLEDHINNIEQVLVDNPEAGTWTVEVVGFNVPVGPQVFSLVGDGPTNMGMSISFPNGLPTILNSGVIPVIDVRVSAIGDTVVPGSPTVFYRYTGGAFVSAPLTLVAGDLYQATLPVINCGDSPDFYFSAEGAITGVIFQPANAPTSFFSAVVGEAVAIFNDNFEFDQLWVPENLGAISGDWERGLPVNDPAWAYDPVSDFDGSGQCWLTQNQIGNTDVDNGAVRLTSPTIDMSIGNISINYAYYLYLTDTVGGVDHMLVEINSNDGVGPWIEITRHDTNGGLNWRTNTIDQATLDALGVVLTPTMKVRFTTNDADPQSINESGLDAFLVSSFGCGTIVGACCGADGSCTIREQANCMAIGGVYQGDGTSCTPNPCPQPMGACCFVDGSCLVQSLVDCSAANGTFQGVNTVCTPNPCPQPTGGCCHIDGTCTQETAASCTAGGGVYQGDNIPCFPNPCPPPSGACCDAVGSCGIQPASECVAQGGTYMGHGTVCTPNPCPQLTGACCSLLDATCSIETQSACGALGGEYIGDNVPCDPTICQQPQVACCFIDGSCQDLVQADCAAQGGTFQGFSVMCGMNPCPPPPGACCLPDGTCQDVADMLACDTLGGAFQGSGTDCIGTTCLILQGACCYADGSCTDEPDAATCTSLGGAFQGHGTDCLTTVCNGPPGACCHADGSCSDEPNVGTCSALGGTFQGSGTVCATTQCPVLPGACCQPDGSCTDQPDAATCAALGGVFQGNGTDCLTTTCPVLPGACCHPDGSCTDEPDAGTCIALGGMFQGNGSDCLTTVCPLLPGACCYPDGSCTNEADAATCTALGGVFQGHGTDCMTVVCPVFPGACCHSDGSCTNEVDAAACTALGGVFQGHGINCTAVVCEVAGDVDCNGVLDMNDSAALVNVLLGMDIDPCHVTAADMNGDGMMNGNDVQDFVTILIGA
ncbi:MAG: S8 family serine peptidase [Phycisphaerae bacterium]